MMPRSWRHYVTLQRASVQMSLNYRGSIIVMLIVGFLWQGTRLAMILVVLQHFHLLVGWDFRDIAFLYGLRLMAHALWLTPLGSLTTLDFLVRYGDFDQVLLRPVNPFVQASTRPRGLIGVGDVALALAVFGVAVGYAPIHWSLAKVLLCAMFIVSGALIEGSVWVAVSALAFRFTTSQQIGQLTDGSIGTMSSYPLNIFSASTQRVLTFGVHIAFVAYLGAALLLGKTAGLAVPTWVAYLAPAVGLAMFTLAYWFWARQAHHYQSTGQ